MVAAASDVAARFKSSADGIALAAAAASATPVKGSAMAAAALFEGAALVEAVAFALAPVKKAGMWLSLLLLP